MSPIEDLFANTPNLPSVPKVVQELIATLGDDNANLDVLIDEVRHDQALTARVLRLANSSYYGASHTVGAIDQAIVMVGLNALRTLVIASGVTTTFSGVPGIEAGAFWRHSFMTAAVAKRLGKQVGVNAEFAYTTGLMHRVGQLIIHIAHPEAGREIAQACQGVDVTERIAVEQARLGMDHCEVGAELALRWHFPGAIRNALRWYARPLDVEACPYAAIVHLAATTAFCIESGATTADTLARLPLPVAERVILTPEVLRGEIDAAREFLPEANALMQG